MVEVKPVVWATSVLQRLGLKPTARAGILALPHEGLGILEREAMVSTFQKNLSGEFDFLIGFYISAIDLKSDLTRAKKILKGDGVVCVCWQKGNVTDLTRNAISSIANEKGLVLANVISINGAWLGLKLMYPTSQRLN